MPILDEGVLTSFDMPTGVVDISPEFYKLTFPETPFFNEIKVGRKAKTTLVEWDEDQILPTKTKLSAAYTAAGGSLTVEATAGIRVDSVLCVGNSVYRVTAINRGTKVLTVSVVEGDANHLSGDVVRILPTARGEGADAQKSDYNPPVTLENYTQIMDDFAEVTGTQMAIEQEIDIGGDMLSADAEKKLSRIYHGMGEAVWLNPRYKAQNKNEKSITGGVLWFIRHFGYNPAATAFTRENFDTFLRIMEGDYKADMSQMWMNPYELGRFEDIDDNKVIVQRDDPKVGRKVSVYVSKFGYEVRIRTDASIPAGLISLSNPDNIKMRPLRPFVMGNLRKEGDRSLVDIRGEVAFEVNPSNRMGIFSISVG